MKTLRGWNGSIGMAGLLAIMLFVGCGKSTPPPGAAGSAGKVPLTGAISIDGSSTVVLISQAVYEEFDQIQPGVKIDVSSSGTGSGMRMFASGEIDICDASRGIKQSEIEACKAGGVEYIELTIAFDGLAVVVNPKNDWCENVTVEQLKSIWRTESEETIMTWQDVNPDWPDEPLKLYGPGDDSGTFDYFTKVINGEEKSSRRDYQPSEDDNALVIGVAGDKGAMGYFGFAYYAENTDKLKLLGVDSGNGPKKPSEATVRDNSYAPLSRPLFIYVKKASLKRPEFVSFIKFYLAHAAELSTDVGYVPVSDEVAAENQEILKSAL